MADDADIANDDAEALRVRLAELHDFMREIAAAALMLPAPETYLEAERAVRAITMADRMAQDLSLTGANKAQNKDTDEDPNENAEKALATSDAPAFGSIGTALRSLADRIMKAAKTLPMPDSALSVWRALRYARACERMLTQLYVAPKPKPVQPVKPLASPTEPTDYRVRLAQTQRELWEKFSPSPEAKALREARQRAARAAFDAEIATEMAALAAQTPDTHIEGPAQDTKTPTDDTLSLNPRPNISDGQARGHNKGPSAVRKQEPRPPLRGPPSP